MFYKQLFISILGWAVSEHVRLWNSLQRFGSHQKAKANRCRCYKALHSSSLALRQNKLECLSLENIHCKGLHLCRTPLQTVDYPKTCQGKDAYCACFSVYLYVCLSFILFSVCLSVSLFVFLSGWNFF
jgi:hypothetical protein